MSEKLGIREMWIDGKCHWQVRSYPGGKVIDTFDTHDKALACVKGGGETTTKKKAPAKKSRKKSTKGKKK